MPHRAGTAAPLPAGTAAPLLTGAALQRTSLREQALALLREALITGRIADGAVYSAKALAVELGVSNGPIREAMLALVNDGLMEAVPNKGFRTVPLTPAGLAEIYEMRLLLEVPTVARLAGGALPGETAARLTALVDTIEQTARRGDLGGNLAADRDFHLTLLAAGGNRRLVDTVARLRDQTRLHNLRAINADGSLVASADEHRPLLAAVLGHDERAAGRLMRRHLEHIREDWSRPG
ncbi:MAG TPA: GntR family transcriptional regulator [Streptosporangiaceae bacterium]|jgi:DNA-binding GntR family transcriptional regulator